MSPARPSTRHSGVLRTTARTPATLTSDGRDFLVERLCAHRCEAVESYYVGAQPTSCSAMVSARGAELAADTEYSSTIRYLTPIAEINITLIIFVLISSSRHYYAITSHHVPLSLPTRHFLPFLPEPRRHARHQGDVNHALCQSR